MSWKKRVLKHPMTQVVFAWLLSLYIRFVYATSRVSLHIDDDAKPYMDGKDNAIYAFWHGRMMMMPMRNPSGIQMRVLISFHHDGLLISQVVKHLHTETIGGSSSRGGREAVKVILKGLRAGDNIGITPDGPRGPNQIASKGIETIARLSGKPVIPVTFSASRHRRLKSWDRFILALPFGHIAFFAGSPIVLDKDADDTQQALYLQAIEKAMNEQLAQADLLTHGQ
jgi:lysophospholipid acyltransferase (LPLAT)-like uncharacterized protein